eukprot:166538-Chlamydomonas_euryale.AAC.1
MGIRLAPQLPMWVYGNLNPHTKSPNGRSSTVIQDKVASVPLLAKFRGEKMTHTNRTSGATRPTPLSADGRTCGAGGPAG